MQRHCGRCHTDFDDELYLSVCPHHFGQRAQVQAESPTMDAVNDLMMVELEDLLLEYGGFPAIAYSGFAVDSVFRES